MEDVVNSHAFFLYGEDSYCMTKSDQKSVQQSSWIHKLIMNS